MFKNSFMEFMDFHQCMKFIMCSFADPQRRKSHPSVCKGPSSRKGPSVKMGVHVHERPTPKGWRLVEHSACKLEENLKGWVRASPKSARRTSTHFVECDRRRGQKRHSSGDRRACKAFTRPDQRSLWIPWRLAMWFQFYRQRKESMENAADPQALKVRLSGSHPQRTVRSHQPAAWGLGGWAHRALSFPTLRPKVSEQLQVFVPHFIRL